MMNLLNDVTIRCKRCGEQFFISKDYIDFDSYVISHGENGMGDELEYRCEDNIICNNCGNTISFRIYGSEYPIGAFNYDDCEIEGGTFIEIPRMGMIYSREDFDPDVAN